MTFREYNLLYRLLHKASKERGLDRIDHLKLTRLINKADEEGNMTKNIFIDAIIKLWGECQNPQWIAQKLDIRDEVGEYDVELVEMIIENPANYGVVVATTGDAK